MSSRPRRAAASRSARGQPGPSSDPDADPDFLALSARQRRAIDKAFERGLRAADAGGRKRRKLDKGKAVDVGPSAAAGGFLDNEDGGGGFVDDDEAGGGFMLDEDGGAGGFLPDDDGGGGGGFMLDDGDDEMGGFVPDEPASTAPTTRTNTRPTTPVQSENVRIPLHVLPGLLGSLDLPTDDDVLAVFRASATGWDDDNDDGEAGGAGDAARRRKRGEPGEDEMVGGGVGKKDFRAVCAALMGPDDQPDGAGDAEMSSDDASDTFELEEAEDDSSLSEASSEAPYGRGKAGGRAKSGAKGAPTSTTKATRRGRKNKVLEEDERVKLSSKQREMVAAIWAMIKPPKVGGPQRGGMVLGRDELKVVVRDFGEMWTDEEITDMITLFSSQHEGRGLTFDDFGAVMLRAGLV